MDRRFIKEQIIKEGIRIQIISKDLLNKIEMNDLKNMLEKYGYEQYGSGRELSGGDRVYYFFHKDENGEKTGIGAYWSNTKDLADHFEVLRDTLDGLSMVSGRTTFNLWADLANVSVAEAAQLLIKASGLNGRDI